jgi:hypothetical protein
MITTGRRRRTMIMIMGLIPAEKIHVICAVPTWVTLLSLLGRLP